MRSTCKETLWLCAAGVSPLSSHSERSYHGGSSPPLCTRSTFAALACTWVCCGWQILQATALPTIDGPSRRVLCVTGHDTLTARIRHGPALRMSQRKTMPRRRRQACASGCPRRSWLVVKVKPRSAPLCGGPREGSGPAARRCPSPHGPAASAAPRWAASSAPASAASPAAAPPAAAASLLTAGTGSTNCFNVFLATCQF